MCGKTSEKGQNMPIEDSTIDIGLIVAGWQYLQYPEKVSLELSPLIFALLKHWHGFQADMKSLEK